MRNTPEYQALLATAQQLGTCPGELHAHIKTVLAAYTTSKEFTQLPHGRRSHVANLNMLIITVSEALLNADR